MVGFTLPRLGKKLDEMKDKSEKVKFLDSIGYAYRVRSFEGLATPGLPMDPKALKAVQNDLKKLAEDGSWAKKLQADADSLV